MTALYLEWLRKGMGWSPVFESGEAKGNREKTASQCWEGEKNRIRRRPHSVVEFIQHAKSQNQLSYTVAVFVLNAVTKQINHVRV